MTYDFGKIADTKMTMYPNKETFVERKQKIMYNLVDSYRDLNWTVE